MRYRVMFEYTIPQFSDLTIEADANLSTLDVKELAMTLFYESYPEAMDVELVEVQELGPNA